MSDEIDRDDPVKQYWHEWAAYRADQKLTRQRAAAGQPPAPPAPAAPEVSEAEGSAPEHFVANIRCAVCMADTSAAVRQRHAELVRNDRLFFEKRGGYSLCFTRDYRCRCSCDCLNGLGETEPCCADVIALRKRGLTIT